MHSFVPSLSFLVSLFLLPLQLHTSLFGLFDAQSAGSLNAFAFAAEISTVNHTISSRDVNVLGHNARRRRHAEVGEAVNARSDLMLYPGRRAANAQFTHFDTGLGACGLVNKPSDFVVALDMQEFDVAKHCFAVVTITAKGKTAQATIVDRCKGCGFNNLDLTTGLYAYFDPSMFGVFPGEWEYGAGAPAPTPTTTTKKATPPTPSTTSHRVTTSKPATSSTSAVATTSASITATASLVSSTTPSAPTATGNIQQLYLAVLGIGALALDSLPSSK